MSTELVMKYFLITYDGGDKEKPQKLKVPQTLYEQDSEFSKFVISFKCLDCGLEFHYDRIEKESKNGT